MMNKYKLQIEKIANEIEIPYQLRGFYDPEYCSEKRDKEVKDFLYNSDYGKSIKPQMQNKNLVAEDGWGNSLFYDKKSNQFYEHVHDNDPENLQLIGREDYLNDNDYKKYKEYENINRNNAFARARQNNPPKDMVSDLLSNLAKKKNIIGRIAGVVERYDNSLNNIKPQTIPDDINITEFLDSIDYIPKNLK